MKRITYILAALAVLLATALGAVMASGSEPMAWPPFCTRPECWEEESPPPALAGFKTRSGGTEIAVSRSLTSTPGVVLAGFDSTRMGTEVAY
jgi:hypothetical protein